MPSEANARANTGLTTGQLAACRRRLRTARRGRVSGRNHRAIRRPARCLCSMPGRMRVSKSSSALVRSPPRRSSAGRKTDWNDVPEVCEELLLEVATHEVEMAAAEQATHDGIRHRGLFMTAAVEECDPADRIVEVRQLGKEPHRLCGVVPGAEEVDHVPVGPQGGRLLDQVDLMTRAMQLESRRQAGDSGAADEYLHGLHAEAVSEVRWRTSADEPEQRSDAGCGTTAIGSSWKPEVRVRTQFPRRRIRAQASDVAVRFSDHDVTPIRRFCAQVPSRARGGRRIRSCSAQQPSHVPSAGATPSCDRAD